MIRHLGAVATLLLLGLVLWMGADLAIRGAPGFSLAYLIEGPRDLGRAGGIGPVLVSTAMIVSLATLLAGLVSLPTAIAYTELATPSWCRHLVYAVLDIGVGVPRICLGVIWRRGRRWSTGLWILAPHRHRDVGLPSRADSHHRVYCRSPGGGSDPA